MKRAHCVIVRACSWLTGHTGALIIGLAVVWMASAPSPAWGQWTGGPTGPIYYNGGNVGIGTSNPGHTLELFTSGVGGPGLKINAAESGAGAWAIAVGASGNPSLGSGNVGFYDYSSTSWTLILQKNSGNVGIGTTAPQYKLAVNGTIGAKEVIVTNTGWADYVFDPGYRLRPLTEVGAYVREHGHLPGIPSAYEIQTTGIGVGEMQVKLLAKIEELTLHAIAEHDRNDRLERHNRELQERIERLEFRSHSR